MSLAVLFSNVVDTIPALALSSSQIITAYSTLTVKDLIDLPVFEDHPGAGKFDANNTTRLYAEDLNRLRQALQKSQFGIKTETLDVSNIDTVTATIKGSLIVGENGMDIGALDMTSAGASSVLIAERDVHLNDGVKINSWDPSDDQHLASSFLTDHGVQSSHLPFTSIAGITSTWANHRHESDGTDLIPESGFADNAFISEVIDNSIFGLTASDALNGEDGNKAFKFVKEGMAASHDGLGPNLKLPMFSQFISPWEIKSIASIKTTTALEESQGSGTFGVQRNALTLEKRRLFDDYGPDSVTAPAKYGAGIARCYANPLGPTLSPTDQDYLKYTGLLVSDPISPGLHTSVSGSGGRFQIMLPGYLYGSSVKIHFIHGNNGAAPIPAFKIKMWESLMPVSGGPFDSIANENKYHYPVDGDIALDTNDIGYNSAISPFSRIVSRSLNPPGVNQITRAHVDMMPWPSSLLNKHAFSADDNRPWVYSVRFVGDDMDAAKQAFVFGIFITCDPEANL